MSKNPKSSGLLDKGENKTNELFTEICMVIRLDTEIRSPCSEVGLILREQFSAIYLCYPSLFVHVNCESFMGQQYYRR